MLRTYAVLALGAALIAWGANYMGSTNSASRAGMVEDLASGLMGAVDRVLPNDDAAPPADAAGDELAIGGTDGAGVSLRDDCLDEARVDGGLTEGSPVTRVSIGEGRCAGWSLVRYVTAEADIETWVRDQYLAAPTGG